MKTEDWQKELEELEYKDDCIAKPQILINSITAEEHDAIENFIQALLYRVRKEDQQKLEQNIGMMRQWLNEDRITDKKMVTNEELRVWLIKQ